MARLLRRVTKFSAADSGRTNGHQDGSRPLGTGLGPMPEAVLDPALSCGNGSLSRRSRGGGSMPYRSVASSLYEDYRQRRRSSSVVDTPADTSDPLPRLLERVRGFVEVYRRTLTIAEHREPRSLHLVPFRARWPWGTGQPVGSAGTLRPPVQGIDAGPVFGALSRALTVSHRVLGACP